MEGSYRRALLNRGFESHSLRQRVHSSLFSVHSSPLAVPGLALREDFLLLFCGGRRLVLLLGSRARQ
jgi:hypothetical protein